MASKYNPREVRPGLSFQSREELEIAAGGNNVLISPTTTYHTINYHCDVDIGTTIFHPVGTCKMARSDDPMGVVDSSLKVRGIARLRIADASVMPTIISANTASPVMVIAEKCADMLLRDNK
jgi:choline dehydrogenase